MHVRIFPLRPALGAALAAALSCLAPASSLAQAPRIAVGPVVQPAGVVARIFAPRVLEGTPGASPYFVGELVAADDSWITLRTATGEVVTIPSSFAEQFSVRTGFADRARSARQAALAGAALGFIVGKLSSTPGKQSSGERRRYAVNASAVGLLSGVAFAVVNPWHRWTRSPLPTAVSGVPD